MNTYVSLYVVDVAVVVVGGGVKEMGIGCFIFFLKQQIQSIVKVRWNSNELK